MPEMSEPGSVKPYPWKCAQCRQPTVNPTTIDYTETIEHDGRTYEVHVPQLHLARCETCGQVVLDDDANERISDTLRHQLGVLLPAQIRRSRERLGISPTQLANDLGVAEASLSRWEAGAQIPDRWFGITTALRSSVFTLPETH